MKKALLIIDVQNDYFQGGRCELYHPEQALEAIQHLIEEFRMRKQPIFYIQHIADEHASFFIPKTEGVNIHEAIAPLSTDRIIIKHYPNSFFETNLHDELKKADIEELIVCGMMTHMCIDTTTRAAVDYGYKVSVIDDACTTKDLVWNNIIIPARVVQNVYMASLHQRFASVVSSEIFLNT